MNRKLHIVGVGPGDREYILPAAQKLIEHSGLLIGGKRNLELFNHVKAEKTVIENNLEDISRCVEENIDYKAITVLASGDPGIFSIMEYLKNRLKDIELCVVPGISSFQYLCSKLNTSWHDIRIASLHGRGQKDLVNIVGHTGKVAVLTGGKSSPDAICRDFIKNNLTDITVSVGENLSYPNERIVTGKPEEISGMSFDSLSVMVVFNEKAFNAFNTEWKYTTPGIPDSMFIRGDAPMTKEEVRALSISKLRLGEGDTVYDVGAGTGSVSIECGHICKNGKVYAIEREAGYLELIEKNIQKFRLNNIQVVEGEAPSVLAGLPEPDRVFIGGSCGKMQDILHWIMNLDKAVRVVVNAVTIESVYEALKGFEKEGFENIDATCISVSRGRAAGDKHLMQALNPIYIICAEYGGKNGW